jgi:hypothetical protein
MTEAELKACFDKEVSAPDKRLVWEWLKDEHYVSEVCSGLAEWEEFRDRAVELAARQRETLGRANPPGRTQKLPFAEVFLTDAERKQVRALKGYLAKRAARLPEVWSFRQEKLDGLTLEPEQIVSFLRSEMEDFSFKERSDLDFALELVPSYFDGDEQEELMDLVGGYLYRSRESEQSYRTENVRRAIELESMAMACIPFDPLLYGVMHLIHDKSGRTLEGVARLLTSRYPWTLRDTAWFVLTDEPPDCEPLQIRYDDTRGMYSLTFAPWISEKTIRNAYHSLFDADSRGLSDKRLSVFCFVDEHTEPGQTPKWSELMDLWNKQNPENRFRHRSALRRAYKRVEERLASPWMNEKRHPAGSHF